MKLTNYGSKFIDFYSGADLNQTNEELYNDFMKTFQNDKYYQIIFKNLDKEKILELLRSNIANFDQIRSTFEQFNNDIVSILEGGVMTFRKYFIDYSVNAEILVGHSLGSFDGGMRKDGKGNDYLMFGMDVMSRIYHNVRPSPFLIHELFHDYHKIHYEPLKERSLFDALWTEGLATYMSFLVYPDANRDELLLNVPTGLIEKTEENIVKLLDILIDNLEKYNMETYRRFFSGPFNDVNYRSGYYIGFLFAMYISSKFSLDEMVKISGVDLLPHATVFLNDLKDNFELVKTSYIKIDI